MFNKLPIISDVDRLHKKIKHNCVYHWSLVVYVFLCTGSVRAATHKNAAYDNVHKSVVDISKMYFAYGLFL